MEIALWFVTFTLNPLEVLTAAATAFVVGGVWYSVLFAKSWQRLAGVSDAQLKKGNAPIFVSAFLLAVVIAAALSFIIGPLQNAGLYGAWIGLLSGLGWVAAAFGINYLYERRPLALYAINAGYNVVSFTVMGALIGQL